jgi:hypothetical protein
MIDLGDLIARGVTGAHVAFDLHGSPLEIGSLPDEPALLLARPVTDAVKEVEADRVVSSKDRSEMVQVEGFALGPDVLRKVGPRFLDAEQLIEAVRSAGFSWVLLEPNED